MSYQLVIAEKPSVARSIAGVIGATEKHDGYLQGNGYLVSWCIGHLVSFADAGRYDERFKKWRYEDLPILPETWQYIIPDEKKQQFDILRSLMERPDVTGLVCATDAGREGELIFRFVYQMAGCEKPFKRLWISSMEDNAIRDGFANLKPETDYDPLYQSALCRAKADWLIGINATRLFSVLYHKTLTVGRVQTPTLNLLVERDAKITNFKKEKYHIVHIGVGDADAVSSRFSDAGEANTVKAACAGAQAVCASVTREKKTEQPPKLYDLTTLQREANRLFGFTAKQTLDYAQTLYEKKLLTYPRTDSQYLTDDMLPVAENLVSGLWELVPFAKGLNLSPQFDRMLLGEFVPYMKLHCNLSHMEQEARRPLLSGEELTPEQEAYFHAVLDYVQECRPLLNQGQYQLPEPPKLSDFDQTLQDYKEQVQAEIAQEAAAAGMTVEEYAAAGYEAPEQDSFSIYQIKSGDETRDYRFEPFDRLQATGHSVDRANYDLVYTAPLDSKTTLEDIYRTFNIDHPADFKGHSLSVSDVVVLHQGGKDTAHYCDSFGFQPVPEFLQENPLRTAELSTEQNENMIDSVINNTPSMGELEAKVKAGEQIFLTDLADAAKAEAKKPKAKQSRKTQQKKLSIRAQLKAAQEEQAKRKPAREKSQELEV